LAAVALVLVPISARAQEPTASSIDEAGWQGVLGVRASVSTAQRYVVLLEPPSLADRVSAAGGHASETEMRAWTAAVVGQQELFLARLMLGLMGAVSSFVLAVVVLNVAYGTALYRARRIHPFTWRHAVTTAAALGAVIAATALQSTYPVGGWMTAHVLAILIVAANVDLRSMLGAVRDRAVALR